MLSGSGDGVPIRVCATPDQVKYGAFALSTAEYAAALLQPILRAFQ